jgi:5-enolpyruvylshikimate-3-phosphate synthase
LKIKSKKLKEEKKLSKRPKGDLVEFTNNKGEKITGYGVKYYYVTVDGKSHLKQCDLCKVIEKEEK